MKMEELLRQAFQLGQQWVKDMNDNIDPISFNDWYSSKEVQEELNKTNVSDLIKHNNKVYKIVSGKVDSGDLVRLKDSGDIFILGNRSEMVHNLWFSDDYKYRSVARYEFDKLEEFDF